MVNPKCLLSKMSIFQNVHLQNANFPKCQILKIPNFSNVQFHLLSMIAPPNKKVVNIGSPSINDDNNNNHHHWFHLSPSFRPYSKNNLEISR
ncbi:unnamed protein product [Meloidogyne enterolobii]|uniref:Uncharacterized protein n=1 Tax=Meloidogyne enterolobii TaxID=390850 RepID=A0ACB0XU31_MELEN